MSIDWEHVVARLRSYSANINQLLPPCPEDRIRAVQAELGEIPRVLVNMLSHFNGGELFVDHGPLISIFGISTIPPLPPLEWAPDWYIDKFTPSWRSSSNRRGDWVIAMWNYGGLVVLDECGLTKEWDTAVGNWGERTLPLDEWVEDVFREGNAFLEEI